MLLDYLMFEVVKVTEKLFDILSIGVSLFLVLVSAFFLRVYTSSGVLEGASPVKPILLYGVSIFLLSIYLVQSTLKNKYITLGFSILSIMIYTLTFVIF